MLRIRSTLHHLTRPPAAGRHRQAATRRRRSIVVAASVVTTGLILAAVPGSAPAAGPTTQVAFVPISPAKVVMNGSYVGANATTSVAVADGTTTVPSGATTVQLSVSVKGAKGGTLKIFPMGLPSSGDTIAFAAGNVVATATVDETVGLSDKVSVTNVSASAATVTTKILGYSTQVTATAINGSGGTAGQVLTDTGAGVAWRSPSTAYGQKVSAGFALSLVNYDDVATLSLPAGSYLVQYTGAVYDGGAAATVGCYLLSPTFQWIDTRTVSTPGAAKFAEIDLQGLVHLATAGTVLVQCEAYTGVAPYISTSSMSALTIGALGGTFVNGAGVHAAKPREVGRH